MDFIRLHQNIIITEKTGTGKSFLAQAIANRAIQYGFKVYYVKVQTLIEEIKIARDSRTSTNLLKKYLRFHLLILDDFEILEDRSDLNSTIITSQLPVSKWYDYLNNNTVADAILNRVIHSSQG